MSILELYVDEEASDRLDAFIANELDNVSRTYIQKLIKEGRIEVNGSLKRAKYLVQEGDRISIDLPETKKIEILPEDIPIEIIYEDEDIVVVNKPQGMVVHPAPGNYSGTLVNSLLYNVDSLSYTNDMTRPGIVHRLDKDTSGILVVAKNDSSHISLVNQLKERSVYREYIALVHDVIKENFGTIDKPIGRDPKNRKKMTVIETNSKEAITDFEVLKRYDKYTLVKLQLQTGRTHQIRVHFSHINHPVVGDPVYSNRKNNFKLDMQLLHARKIGFIHPRTGEAVEFQCDPPDVFKTIIKKLNNRGD